MEWNRPREGPAAGPIVRPHSAVHFNRKIEQERLTLDQTRCCSAQLAVSWSYNSVARDLVNQ